jgi:hypothetical protein
MSNELPALGPGTQLSDVSRRDNAKRTCSWPELLSVRRARIVKFFSHMSGLCDLSKAYEFFFTEATAFARQVMWISHKYRARPT